MRAKKCDACGGLVEANACITIAVDVPYVDEEDGSMGWTDIDICHACVLRPMIEVLTGACQDFSLAPEAQKEEPA